MEALVSPDSLAGSDWLPKSLRLDPCLSLFHRDSYLPKPNLTAIALAVS